MQIRKPAIILKLGLVMLSFLLSLVSFEPRAKSLAMTGNRGDSKAGHRPPLLGADLSYSGGPFVLIEGWQDQAKGDEMARALSDAGLRSFRFCFGGIYSPLGEEATARVKDENHFPNQYPWFPLDDYAGYIAKHDFTTVVGINVEEGPEVAFNAIKKFIDRNSSSKIVAVELSNEPWLSRRPWQPEEFATRSAEVIDRLAPLGVKFAVPLTVGGESKTPTGLSDDEWNRRMLTSLSKRIDLKSRSDIYGVLHLYGRGVSAGTVEKFNKAVKPFAPGMKYLVTEFNIRSNLTANPQLTNAYALEFARKLAELMSCPELVVLYVHAIPYHSIIYWANGRRTATVYGQRDPRLTGEAMSRGWHLTPPGKVYRLYSRLAWNGVVISYHGGDQSYWVVKKDDGDVVVSLLNSSSSEIRKTIKVEGKKISLAAPPQSIVCFDSNGREMERLSLAG